MLLKSTLAAVVMAFGLAAGAHAAAVTINGPHAALDCTTCHANGQFKAYTILALILECFSMAWMTLLITAGADLLKFFGRRPSVAKLGNTAMGSMFLLFASKLALDA